MAAIKSKKSWILVLALFLFLGVVSLLRFGLFGRPRDGELVTFFQKHHETLDKLRLMALEDAGRATYLSKETLRQVDMGEDRRDQYRQLFEQIGWDLVVRIDAREVSFSYSSGGVGLARNHSWMKGIAYLPYGPERMGTVVKGLDELGKRDGIYLMPVEGNWYLVYKQLD